MTDYEPRHCFIEQGHNPHDWNVDLKDQDLALPDVLHYHCDGSNIERDPWGGEENVQAPVPVPNTELAYRPEYGDPLQNMREQAAMFRAYLSGRDIEAHDVPAFFILAKIHRLGKMPDYLDNYTDIKGYLRLLEGLIGEDMIDAPTADEYRRVKNRGGQKDGRTIDHQNPYRNAP